MYARKEEKRKKKEVLIQEFKYGMVDAIENK